MPDQRHRDRYDYYYMEMAMTAKPCRDGSTMATGVSTIMGNFACRQGVLAVAGTRHCSGMPAAKDSERQRLTAIYSD
jgi:hypothetical protein